MQMTADKATHQFFKENANTNVSTESFFSWKLPIISSLQILDLSCQLHQHVLLCQNSENIKEKNTNTNF